MRVYFVSGPFNGKTEWTLMLPKLDFYCSEGSGWYERVGNLMIWMGRTP